MLFSKTISLPELNWQTSTPEPKRRGLPPLASPNLSPIRAWQRPVLVLPEKSLEGLLSVPDSPGLRYTHSVDPDSYLEGLPVPDSDLTRAETSFEASVLNVTFQENKDGSPQKVKDKIAQYNLAVYQAINAMLREKTAGKLETTLSKLGIGITLECEGKCVSLLPTLRETVAFDYEGPETLFLILTVLAANQISISANTEAVLSDTSSELRWSQLFETGKARIRNGSLKNAISPVGSGAKPSKFSRLPETMQHESPLKIQCKFPLTTSSFNLSITHKQSRSDHHPSIQSYKNIFIQRHMMMTEYSDIDIAKQILAVVTNDTAHLESLKLAPHQLQWIHHLTFLLFGPECHRNRRSFFYNMIALDAVKNEELPLAFLLNDYQVSTETDLTFKKNFFYNELKQLSFVSTLDEAKERVAHLIKQGILQESPTDQTLVQFDLELSTKKTPEDCESLIRAKAPLLEEKLVKTLVSIAISRIKVAKESKYLFSQYCLPMIKLGAIQDTAKSLHRMGVKCKDYFGSKDTKDKLEIPTSLEESEMFLLRHFANKHPEIKVVAEEGDPPHKFTLEIEGVKSLESYIHEFMQEHYFKEI